MEIRVQPRGMCDFCSSPAGEWLYMTRKDERLPIEGTPWVMVADGGWTACTSCKELIEGKNEDGLRRRSVERFARHYADTGVCGAAIDLGVKRVHSAFWRQRIGEPRHLGS